jgi:hypothetical protein
MGYLLIHLYYSIFLVHYFQSFIHVLSITLIYLTCFILNNAIKIQNVKKS